MVTFVVNPKLSHFLTKEVSRTKRHAEALNIGSNIFMRNSKQNK